MPFAKTLSEMSLNGHSSVFLAKKGGSLVDVGYVGEVMAKADPIVEETTFGDPSIGYNLSIEAKIKQTGPATWAEAINNNIELDAAKISGQVHDVNITGGLFANYQLQKGFNNKAGESFITMKAMYPGAANSTAATFIAAHS